MSGKKRFLLRLDDDLYTALEKWAADDIRSVNAQMEFLLAEALRAAGRTRRRGESRALPGEDRPAP